MGEILQDRGSKYQNMFSWMLFLMLLQNYYGMEYPDRARKLPASLETVNHSAELNKMAYTSAVHPIEANLEIEPAMCSLELKEPAESSNGSGDDQIHGEESSKVTILSGIKGKISRDSRDNPTRASEIEILKSNLRDKESRHSNNGEKIARENAGESWQMIENPINEAHEGNSAQEINPLVDENIGPDIEVQNQDEECAVCLAFMDASDLIYVLTQCQHRMHGPCIARWLFKHTDRPTCPACRGDASQDVTKLVMIYRGHELLKVKRRAEMKRRLDYYMTWGDMGGLAVIPWTAVIGYLLTCIFILLSSNR